MRLNAKGLRAATTRAAACAASLLLTALAQGCFQTTNMNGVGASPTPTTTQAALATPGPAQTAQPDATATPSSDIQITDSPLPAPTGFVNDFAEVLAPEAEARLEETLKRLKERENIELAVVTVGTTGGRDIKDYSLAVARGWGVGPPEGQGGGGLLLLLAVNDRKWRIQVSRSLEADLPDDVAAQIGERMVPHLRTAQYAEAFGACVEGLVKRLAERRGLSSHDVQWILQPPPAASPQPPAKSKSAARAKS